MCVSVCAERDYCRRGTGRRFCKSCERKFPECRSLRETGRATSRGREPQGGTNRKDDQAEDSKDEVQLAEKAKKTLDVEGAGAGWAVRCSERSEHAVDRPGNLRRRIRGTWRGKSSDRSGNNCSARRNVGRQGEGRRRRVITRGRKGCLGQKAEKVRKVNYVREVWVEAGRRWESTVRQEFENTDQADKGEEGIGSY